MALSNEEKMKAIRISRALEEYLKTTGKTMMRSTEVYEYLARHKFVVRDKHQGVYFRKFLHKLKRENALDLIPQCTAMDNKGSFTEWYFHPAPEKMPKTIIVKEVHEYKESYGANEALSVLKKIAAGIDPRNGETLDNGHLLNDSDVRKALWFAIEEMETPTTESQYSSDAETVHGTKPEPEVVVDTPTSKKYYQEYDDVTNQIITEVEKTIASLSLIKTTEVQPAFVQKQRKEHPRAFEPWSKQEDELLLRLHSRVDDLKSIAKALQRNTSSITARLTRLSKL